MSLIVGQCGKDFVRLVGDSRLTKNGQRASDIFSGSLKIVIISESICIAYAGTCKYGEAAIKNVNPSDSLEKIIDILMLTSKDRSLDVEFLVAIRAPEGRAIYKIKDGRVNKCSEGRTWIGDVNAYNFYQQRYASQTNTESLDDIPVYIKDMSKLDNAMTEVINNPDIENVGDLQISAYSASKGFSYAYRFNSTVANLRLTPGLNRIPFSTGPNTDSMLQEILVPLDFGVGMVAVYVYEFKAGALYAPLLYEKPEVLRVSDVDEFRALIQQKSNREFIKGGFSLR